MRLPTTCLKLELMAMVMVMMKLMRKAPPGDSDEHKKMPCTTSTWATATFASSTSNKSFQGGTLVAPTWANATSKTTTCNKV